LLAGLLAHLVFMDTPAHAAMLAPGDDEAHQQLASTPLRLEPPNGAHCAVEWAATARPLVSIFWLTAAASSPGPLASRGSTGWRPVPRALGPPQEADQQALLQVFRT
jgi:hypothetical protein